MQWIFVFLFFLMQLPLVCQTEKFSKDLMDFGIKLCIDSNDFKKITYPERKAIFAKQGLDFEEYLKEKQVEALMIYYPAKFAEKEFSDQLSIVITVKKQTLGEPISLKIADTIQNPGANILSDLQTNTTDGLGFYCYYDKATQTTISKNLYKLIEKIILHKNKFPEYVESKRKVYSILQSFQVEKLTFEIEYRCYDDLADIYFVVFEKIMHSLSWEIK